MNSRIFKLIIFVWMVIIFQQDLLSGPVRLEATQTPAQACWWERTVGRDPPALALLACARV